MSSVRWRSTRPDRRVLLSDAEQVPAPAGQRPQALWHGHCGTGTVGSVVPRHPATRSATTASRGCGAPTQGHRQLPGGHQELPGGPTRWGADLRDPRQLERAQATKITAWCERNNVELCFTPTYSSWANPIECHVGLLRNFVLNNSDHPNHTVLPAGSTRTCTGGTSTTPIRPCGSPDANEPDRAPSASAVRGVPPQWRPLLLRPLSPPPRLSRAQPLRPRRS